MACQSSGPRLPVHRRDSGACQDTRRSNRPCATTTSSRSVSPVSMSLSKLNPVEPPWYVIRMPGGVGGRRREASPYPDLRPQSRHLQNALKRRLLAQLCRPGATGSRPLARETELHRRACDLARRLGMEILRQEQRGTYPSDLWAAIVRFLAAVARRRVGQIPCRREPLAPLYVAAGASNAARAVGSLSAIAVGCSANRLDQAKHLRRF